MNATQDIPIVGGALRLLFGSRNERFVKRYTSRTDAITALEPKIRLLTDAQLREKTVELRKRARQGETAVDLMNEAFAVGREAMDRAVGVRNIFNPLHADKFDPSRLSDEVRELYNQTKAKMEACEDAEPVGEFLGCDKPQQGWLQIDIPIEIYNAVRELYPESKPPFRARPFDVQLIGATVLHQGKISEMKTGEGKTIVAPLACYLASIEGLRCHVVTVNDYLVQRDRDWVYPFFHALGLTVGAIHPSHMQSEDDKRLMYQCDVVYGTTAEIGFDYLRDNMKRSVDQQVQGEREFAIVDEVDSILVDEARTPLIISGPAFDDSPRYELADRLARRLFSLQKPWADADEKVQTCTKLARGLEGDIRNARDKSVIPAMQERLKKAKADLPNLEIDRDQHTQYYEVELDKKQAHLTHHGIEAAQKEAGLGSFYIGDNVDVPHLLEQAIRAHVVYLLDRDYVVTPLENPQTGKMDASVVIVDTFTGRPMIGRQWSDGLHQAIEAKEGVPIKQETQTVATITIQNLFKMYKRLAGMTGTADTEAQEFHDIYKLDVVVIPTNKPCVRADFNDLVFLAGKDKWTAIVDEIKTFHDVGRPVLVGTTSVESSENLSKMLTKRHGVKHEILNAKQHEREAHIIENAGQLGAVMIATNMAGRGTDIKLGSITREQLLDHWLRRGLAPRELTTDASDDEARELIYRKIASKELGITKRDVETKPFVELELELLRKWTTENTWLDQKKIDRLNAEDLRKALDEHGRFLLHRIGWVDNIEQLGGLHVVGTERHESRRIDNQLRGRCGRQGDKGSSRFFVGLDDDLMKMFAGETTMKILSRLGMKEGDAIEHPMLTKSVERAQRKVEERNFQIRKNLLEYDEIMEHQRQRFYKLRQSALEGRNMKGIIFGEIKEAVADAVEQFLDRDYPAELIAERIRQQLNISIPVERLRGVDRDDVEKRIRSIISDEARLSVELALGEYMPADAPAEEHDLLGFANWAESEVHAPVKASDLRDLSSGEILERLTNAAAAWIEGVDVSDVREFLEKGYGAHKLCEWVKSRFDAEMDPQRVLEAETHDEITTEIIDLARESYKKREIEYPVTFSMEMTMALMRQAPQQASQQLVSWANRRFELDWDESLLRTKMPKQIHDDLLKASTQFVEQGKLDEACAEALKRTDDEALDEHLRTRYGVSLPDRFRGLKGEDRDEAVRASVEGVLRAEMIQFERIVLLDVLDSAWKEHLRSMDLVRDSISFRAISQQDPRIEYKREGARLFEEMQQAVRDRVTEYVFKLRLSPQMQPLAPPAGGGVAPPAAAPIRQPAPQALSASAPAPNRHQGAEPAAPAPLQRGGAATMQAAAGASDTPSPSAPARNAVQTSGGASAQPPKGARAPATPPSLDTAKAGRNDPCPCGSGKKFKKCCGQSSGA